MPVKLKDFITAMARKAGYDITIAEAKSFFDGLPDVDVPDEVRTGIDNSLISLTDAKNNHPDIKNYYQKQSLDSVDKVLNDLLDEFEVDEATKTEILSERSTYKRVPVLTKKLIELQKAKADATGGKAKGEIQKQIDDLHKAIADEKKGRSDDKKAYDDQLTGIRINSQIGTLLTAHKTIHDDLDPEVKSTVINTIINKALQDNQAKFAFDETGKFSLLKNDGTNYFGENHQQITPAQFIEQTLAKTKQLKVSNGSGNNGANNQNNNGNHQRKQDDSKPNPNASVIDLNAQALKDYTASAGA
jgi:hypothetical protein